MKFDVELNHKTIIDCSDERDMRAHDKDCELILGKIGTFAEHGVLVERRFLDEGHKEKAPVFDYFGELSDGIVEEACDLKNGVDFGITDGVFASLAHGQGYTIGESKTYHLVETLNLYHFLSEKGQDAVEKLIDSDEVDFSAFKELVEDKSNLKDTKEFFGKMQSYKRGTVDEKIAWAQNVLNGQEKGKEKEKEKGMER